MTARPLYYLLAAWLTACASPAVAVEGAFAYDAVGNLTSEDSGSVAVPVISINPSDRLGHIGGSTSFGVTATGSAPLAFQWQRNEIDISGATGSTLFLESLVSGDFEGYRVVITNGAGSATSNTAQLILDADEDSLPDAWEITYFGTIAAQPSGGDADADGVSNSDEYKDGTLPNNSSSRYFRLTVQGSAVGISPQQARYAPGTTVTLTAQGLGGLEFVGWTGDASGTANPLLVNMTSDKAIRAMRSSLPVDHSYAPTLTKGLGGSSLDVKDMARQPDGKVLIAGRFDAINGVARRNVARLNADGTLDTTFKAPRFTLFVTGDVFAGTVNAIGVQSDGKILVAGSLNRADGAACTPIVRLLPDGSLDPSFVVPAFFNPDSSWSVLNCLTVQPDDKVIVGGDFTTVGGASRLRVARLLSDGTLDTSFDSSAGANGIVRAATRQSDGAVLIGGSFTQVASTPRNRVARLTATGALDPSFDPGAGSATDIQSLLVDNGGEVYVGGSFTTFNGVPSPSLVRLTSSGAVATAFSTNNPGMHVSGTVYDLIEQPNGMILAAGLRFQSQSPPYATAFHGVLRLSTTGAVDASFAVNVTEGAGVHTIVFPGGGTVWFGGKFSDISNAAQINLARVDSNGAILPTALPLSASAVQPNSIKALAAYPDGRLIVCGNFDLFNGMPCKGLIRLLPDGTRDATFNPNRDADLAAILPDGKIMVANPLVRLNSDGSLDASFVAQAPHFGWVNDFVVQPDGRLIIAGNFEIPEYLDSIGNPYKNITRLTAAGALDYDFYGTTDEEVMSVDLSADGMVLLGGSFDWVNGTERHRIARLLPTGLLDETFAYDDEPALEVLDVHFGDGFVTMAGDFGTFYLLQYYPGNNFKVLTSTGELDPDRNTDALYSDPVYQVSERSDGGFWVGGKFGYSGGGENLICLLPTSVLDTNSFPDLQRPNGEVRGLHEHANHELIVAGSFTQAGGEDRLGLARYVTTNLVSLGAVAVTPAGPSFNQGSDVTLTVTATASSGTLAAVEFEFSTDGENFEPVRDGMPIGGDAWQAVATFVTAGAFYLRAGAIDSLGNRRQSYTQGPFQVLGAPAITSASQAEGTIGVPFSYTAMASQTPLSDFTAANLPAWATFVFQSATNDGLLSGTPNIVGETNVSLTATNAAGSGNGSITLRIFDTYQNWKTTQFTLAEQGDPLLSGPDADFDHDGLSNRMEFALRSNPKTSDLTAVPGVSVNSYGANKHLTLTYRRYKWAGQTTFTPEVSGELSTWNSGPSFTTEVSRTDNGDGTETVVVRDNVPHSSAQRRFIKLKVQTN